MVLTTTTSACCCVSNALSTRVASRGLVLPARLAPATCSSPAASLRSSSRSAIHRLALRAAASDDTTGRENQYVGSDTITAVEFEVEVEEKPAAAAPSSFSESFSSTVSNEEPPPSTEQTQSFELLENIDIKLDSVDTLTIALYGTSALVALWVVSAVVGAIDSIPLFPKLLEVVGLGYTVWFAYRYLIFKEDREELIAKVSELKQQVIGSEDE